MLPFLKGVRHQHVIIMPWNDLATLTDLPTKWQGNWRYLLHRVSVEAVSYEKPDRSCSGWRCCSYTMCVLLLTHPKIAATAAQRTLRFRLCCWARHPLQPSMWRNVALYKIASAHLTQISDEDRSGGPFNCTYKEYYIEHIRRRPDIF